MYKFIFLLFFLFSEITLASGVKNSEKTLPEFIGKKSMQVSPECLIIVSDVFHIEEDILLAFLLTEGGKTGLSMKNKNKTEDVGPFQINTIHFSDMKRKFGLSRDGLLNNGCANAYVAGYLIRSRINEYKPKTDKQIWKALASYHSKTPKYNIRYQKKLKKNYLKIKNFEQKLAQN